MWWTLTWMPLALKNTLLSESDPGFTLEKCCLFPVCLGCGAPSTLTSAWALSRWLSACLPEEQFLSHPLCCVLLGTRCARGTLFTTKTKTNKKMEPPDGLGCDPEASADGKTLPCRSDSCCSLGKSPCLSSKMLELVTSRNQTSSRLRWCSLSN